MENKTVKRKRRMHLRFTTSVYNKDINYLQIKFGILPSLYLDYENGEDNDSEYGLVITFHWLLWQLSFWIDKEVIV